MAKKRLIDKLKEEAIAQVETKNEVEEVKAEVVETVKEEVKLVKKESKTQEVLKFSKKQFVDSKRFAKRKDLVNVLLKESEMYSIAEVENIIHNFLYGKK